MKRLMPLSVNNSDQQILRSKRTQSHTRAKLSDEEFSAIVEANEPLIVLLEYTLTSNTMLSENSIQTRFGGVRLPSTIIQFDAIVINLSDEIVVEIDFANAVNIDNLSVSILPIFGLADSSVHESFDLTHEVVWFVNLRIVWTMMGAIATPCVTLRQVSPEERGWVAIVPKMVAEPIAHLSVSEVLSEGVAEIPCLIQGENGGALLRIVRDQHLIAVHACDVVNVCHVDIIGTGLDALGSMVDTAPIGTSVLGCVIYIKLYLIFRLVSITLITKHFLKQVHNLLVSF